jgi:hypothetical protein
VHGESATNPDDLTIKLIEAIVCLSSASQALASGVDTYDYEVYFWLVEASDVLREVGFDLEPGTIRHELLMAIVALERSEAKASGRMIAEAIDTIHKKLNLLCDGHVQFFSSDARGASA